MTASADLLGRRFTFQTAPGLFSADRVDDGTRLLLSHLPEKAPTSVLDLGCGYGALGLPVAAVHPQACVTLVDRDLIAVETSRRNAVAEALMNVECRGSLGYRDLSGHAYDWVLCNVPARIGRAAIEAVIGGAPRTPGGELRIVVIHDLEPVVREVGAAHGWPVEHVTSSARHGVFRLTGSVGFHPDHEAIYLRDTVSIGGLVLERPHDISEDPAHLRDALPLLIECLPRRGQGRALVWRGGYGAAAITLAGSGMTTTAADCDLLATTYTRRNAARSGVAVSTSDVLDPSTLAGSDRFDVVVGEAWTPAGTARVAAEIESSLARAAPKATVLWLGDTKEMRQQERGHGWTSTVLASRGRYTVTRIVSDANP